MGLEILRNHVWIRVGDDDVLEMMKKQRVQISIGLNSAADQPLYAVAPPVGSQRTSFGVDATEEPIYRAFFAQVAQLCGRTVVS